MAERLGYDSLWVAEANGSEAFSLLGAVSIAAPTLGLGTGVLALQLRTPPLAAMAAATLQQLAPDRDVFLGIGISSPAVAGRWHGASYGDRPLAQVREYVALVRECLSGETVSFDGDFYRVSRFRLGLRASERKPKIVIGALNAGMLKLAGEIADGVLLNYLPASHVPWSVGHVRAGGPAAVYAYVHVGVTDRDRYAEAARRDLFSYAVVDAYAANFSRAGYEDSVAEVRAHHESPRTRRRRRRGVGRVGRRRADHGRREARAGRSTGLRRCGGRRRRSCSRSRGAKTAPPSSSRPCRPRCRRSSGGATVRFVVYGAGAIGGVIGGRLAEHGHDVALIARGAHYEAIRDHGLKIESPDDVVTVPIEVVDHPSRLTFGDSDAVILAMKSQDTAAALIALAAVAAPTTPVLCAQNGVENERIALRRFANVYGICVMCPAAHLVPGVVQAYSAPTPGILHLGRYPAGVDETAEQVASALRDASFASEARPDIMRWKYTKLLMNLGNAAEAGVCTVGRARHCRQPGARGGRDGAARRRHRLRVERGRRGAARRHDAHPPDRVGTPRWRIVVAEPRTEDRRGRIRLSQR